MEVHVCLRGAGRAARDLADVAMCRDHTCKRAGQLLSMIPAALHMRPLGFHGGPQLRGSCLIVLQGRKPACDTAMSAMSANLHLLLCCPQRVLLIGMTQCIMHQGKEQSGMLSYRDQSISGCHSTNCAVSWQEAAARL